MKCPKCGQEAVGNFCSNCGTPLVNDTVRREQETVGRKQENSYDDGDSEQRNPARMESDEKKAASRRRQDARRSSSSAKEDKRDAKQQKQMEKRLHALESERERSERQKNRMERSHQRELERQSREAERTRRAAERSEAHTQSDSNDGPSVLDVTAAGVTGVVVLMARVMQAASFLLMAGITWANAKAFRYGGDDLGYIGTMITEENYGLGLYVGIGVFLVLISQMAEVRGAGADLIEELQVHRHACLIGNGQQVEDVYNHPCSCISSRSGSVPDAEECGQLTADCGRRLCGAGGDQCEPRISAVLQHRRRDPFVYPENVAGIIL